MLTRQHLISHHAFLQRLTRLKTAKSVRKFLSSARHYQLRTLVLLLASAALQQVPVPDSVQQTFARSRKKRVLRRVFGSWAKVKRFLAKREVGEWRNVLGELATLLRPVIAAFIQKEPRQI